MRYKLIWFVVLLVFVSFPVAAQDDLLVSTLFFETDLREALSELVLQTGINIIPDETVRGVVTLDLVDVPLEKALEMMLIGGGFTYRKIDDYYLVGLADPRSHVFQHLVETDTVRLQYLTPEEAMELLPSFYNDYVRAGSNGVLTITGPRMMIDHFHEHIQKIDLPRQQIMIEAIVTEISSDVLQEWGPSMFNYEAEEGEDSDNWLQQLGFDATVLSATSDIFDGSLETQLRMLEGNNLAKIKANPRVLVSDREQADLFVGDTQHIMLEPEGGTARLEQVDAGVFLNVTPRILNENKIQLSISPEISHITEEGTRNLVIRRSELATNVYIENEQTILLAGMTIEDTSDHERKFPILGDIPLIRWFFRQKTEQEGERELLIFVHTEIIAEER